MGISDIHVRTKGETDHANKEDDVVKSQVTGPIWSSGGSADAVSTTTNHFNDVSRAESKLKKKTHDIRCNYS